MAGSPPEKGLAAESPCGGKRPGKEEEELLQWFPQDWLVIDETFLRGVLVLWSWGTVSFPLTLAAATGEQRERGLKGELVPSTVGIL